MGNRMTMKTELGIVASYSDCGVYGFFLIKIRGGCALVCRNVATVCFVWQTESLPVDDAALHHEANIGDG